MNAYFENPHKKTVRLSTIQVQNGKYAISFKARGAIKRSIIFNPTSAKIATTYSSRYTN